MFTITIEMIKIPINMTCFFTSILIAFIYSYIFKVIKVLVAKKQTLKKIFNINYNLFMRLNSKFQNKILWIKKKEILILLSFIIYIYENAFLRNSKNNLNYIYIY